MSRGIDHLVLCVRDLDAARSAYERLGFTLAPRALHPWGTANHVVQMDGNFLEILGVVDATGIVPTTQTEFSFGAFNAEFLGRREGMSQLVFDSADARADQRAFLAMGLRTYAPFEFERDTTLPDGATARVGFSLAFVTDARTPEAAYFVCQQLAPEHFWRAEFQAHPNGARQISEVVMVAEEPASIADLWRRLLGPAAVTEQGDCSSAQSTRGRIAILTPHAFAERWPNAQIQGAPETPYFAGCRVTVDALDTVRTILRENEVTHEDVGASLRIAPPDLNNFALEFTEG